MSSQSTKTTSPADKAAAELATAVAAASQAATLAQAAAEKAAADRAAAEGAAERAASDRAAAETAAAQAAADRAAVNEALDAALAGLDDAPVLRALVPGVQTTAETPSLTAAEAVKRVKRTIVIEDGGQKHTRQVPLHAEEVAAVKDYGTHVVVVTKDGQKFSDKVEA